MKANTIRKRGALLFNIGVALGLISILIPSVTKVQKPKLYGSLFVSGVVIVVIAIITMIYGHYKMVQENKIKRATQIKN